VLPQQRGVGHGSDRASCLTATKVSFSRHHRDCCADRNSPGTCSDLQDSLLEITLRSRVIEKLSVALDGCLFQHEGEPYLGTNEDMQVMDVRFCLSQKVRTMPA